MIMAYARMILSGLVVTCLFSCGQERTLSQRERCAATSLERCEAEGCEVATARQIVAEEPTGDDDCFGDVASICVVDASLYEGNAMCVYVYRDGDVFRLGAPELPEDFRTCVGDEGEPVGCSCASLAGCSR